MNQTPTPTQSDLAAVSRFVDELIVALVNSRVYRADHPRVLASLRVLPPILIELLPHEGDRFTLAAIDNWLVYNGRPMLGASLSAPRLVGPIQARGSGGLEFQRETTEADLVALTGVLLGRVEPGATFAAGNEALARHGCRGVRFLPPYRGTDGHGIGGSGPTRTTADAADAAVQSRDLGLYQSTVDLLQTATIETCQGRSVDSDATRTVVERILDRLARDSRSLMALSRYETYDAFTFGHSIRVALLALNFARALTTDQELLVRIGVAALLHDVGKAHVPFDVLHCRGRLSPEQRMEMEKHPVLGAEILLESRRADPASVAAAFGHHRFVTGQGYPRTIHEAHLSLITRIVKICDVFESLTAVRPYKPAMTPVRAYRIMLSMKGHFDLGLLRRFIEVTGFYPTGSKVVLSDGSKASVRGQSTDVGSPLIEIVEPGERPLESPEARHVDLSNQPVGCCLKVVSLLISDDQGSGEVR